MVCNSCRNSSPRTPAGCSLSAQRIKSPVDLAARVFFLRYPITSSYPHTITSRLRVLAVTINLSALSLFSCMPWRDCQLRSMVSDWSEGIAPSEDYKKYKRAQGRVEAKAAPRRVVGPGSTQLQLVRAMVRAIYDENSELRQSRWGRGRGGGGVVLPAGPLFFSTLGCSVGQEAVVHIAVIEIVFVLWY